MQCCSRGPIQVRKHSAFCTVKLPVVPTQTCCRTVAAFGSAAVDIVEAACLTASPIVPVFSTMCRNDCRNDSRHVTATVTRVKDNSPLSNVPFSPLLRTQSIGVLCQCRQEHLWRSFHVDWTTATPCYTE